MAVDGGTAWLGGDGYIRALDAATGGHGGPCSAETAGPWGLAAADGVVGPPTAAGSRGSTRAPGGPAPRRARQHVTFIRHRQLAAGCQPPPPWLAIWIRFPHVSSRTAVVTDGISSGSCVKRTPSARSRSHSAFTSSTANEV